MERNSLSVVQLNNYIKGVFDDELILKDITVYGEVFECSYSSNSTLFITLKEKETVLHCVRFGGGEKPQIGDTVALRGSVEYYAKGNRVSFVVSEISYFGEGKLRKEFLALKEKLKSEGLFDNQLVLPRFIKKIAVVTSETGAVIHDIASVIAKNNSYIDLFVYSVKVQGDGADEDIAKAIEKTNFLCNEDVIIVARGGGSNNDLSPFNTERVARAVASSKIPVISAVGHETDYTLCDFCASVRAGTPSIAAEIVCRTNETLIGELFDSTSRLGVAINKLRAKASLEVCITAKRLVDYAQGVFNRRENQVIKMANKTSNAMLALQSKYERKTVEFYRKLNASTNSLLLKNESDFKEKVAQLNGANPLKVIASGYAKVYKNGRSVSDVKDIKNGDNLEVTMRDGIVSAEVKSVKTVGEK